MNRAKKSYEWERFIRKAHSEQCEVITRLGDPVIIHKLNTTFSDKTVWFTWLRRKSGKVTQKQKRAMEILKTLGLQVYIWPEK